MTRTHPDDAGREVLSHGDAPPPRSSARVWGTAVVCLVLGVLVGLQLDNALDDRRAAQDLEEAPPALSAGFIQENPDDPGGDLRFAVPLYNGSPDEVTVDWVVAVGWETQDGGFQPVTIPSDSWRVLPLPVQIDCGAIGTAAPERLTVRSTTAHGRFEQRLSMPGIARVLTSERARLCLEPMGSVPTAQDLVGTWFVEEAGMSGGTVVRLREDDTFAIDPDVYRFGTDLDALGSFTRSGARLRLTAAGGHNCRRGDSTVWGLTLLEDGRLHIRHRPTRTRWCGIADGDVWVARRIPDLTAPPNRP